MLRYGSACVERFMSRFLAVHNLATCVFTPLSYIAQLCYRESGIPAINFNGLKQCLYLSRYRELVRSLRCLVFDAFLCVQLFAQALKKKPGIHLFTLESKETMHCLE